MGSLRSWALGATCLAAVVGCGRDTASPREPIPPTDARALGARLAAELSASLGALTPGMPGAVAGRAPRDDGAVCPEVRNPTDSDGDGIPDDAVLLFTLPNCRLIDGTDTLELTGTARLVDPVASPPPNPAAFGYVASLDHLRVRFAPANPDSTALETRTGSEALLLTPDRLTQGHEFTVVREDRSGVVTVTDGWNAVFAPDSGVALVPGQPLRSGVFVIAGRSTWARDGETLAAEIGTAQPLRYDPSCPEQGPNRFESGEVHARLSAPGQQLLVRIVFADCREPTVVVVRVPEG